MRNFFLIVFISLFVVLFANTAMAQCAMCTATAEEAIRNGSSQTASLNKGVLFLFAMPYLLIGTIGFLFWNARRKAKLAINENSVAPK